MIAGNSGVEVADSSRVSGVVVTASGEVVVPFDSPPEAVVAAVDVAAFSLPSSEGVVVAVEVGATILPVSSMLTIEAPRMSSWERPGIACDTSNVR